MLFMLCCESIVLRYSDGYQGFARLWLPPEPRAAVLYLHGIQSHGGWFEGSARFLADAGLAVLLPDRRGSGRNEIDRGHASSVRRWLRDGAECLDQLHVRTGLARFHVVGVSWGGKLALGLYRSAPERISGLSLIAPGWFPRVDLPLSEKVRVGLAAIAGGRGLFEIPLNEPELFTATPKWRRFIADDPMRLRKVTAAFLIGTRRLDRYGQGVARLAVGCPLSVYLAGIDDIIDNDRTKEFVRRLSWSSRRIIEYPKAHHTLEFEEDPGPFWADLREGVMAGTACKVSSGER